MSFILGTSNDDTLTGTAGSDTIQGLGGFDDLTGGDGADTLFGGAGSDLLRGGLGVDFLYGGSGLDLAVYDTATGPVTVNLATGVVTGPDGADVLLSIEALAGSAFADRLTGDAGENLLMGLAGNDTIDGGDGFDLAGYLFASTPVTVNLATGVVSGGGGFDTLIAIEGVLGSDLADTLTGNGNSNVLVGMEGNDTISGGGEVDTASYEYAPSAVTVNLATGTSSGGDGADVLISIEYVIGSGFSDTLTGDAGANYLFGGGGDDTLTGGLGNDTLEGGVGFVFADYRGTAGPVSVDLALNSAISVDGTDLLIGIDGVTGSEFDDRLTGDANLNWFTGRGGNDTIDGAGGPDWANYAQTSLAIVANLGTGTVNVAGGTHDTLLSIEAILGSSANDSIVGSAGGDSIEGYSGNDTLDGAGGVDFVVYRYATSAVTVSLANGVASGGDGADTLSNFEGIVGSLFSDTLTGDAKDNTIEGRAGADTINGGDGTDTVTYANALSGVNVNLATGVVGGGDGADRLASIENAIGSANGDTLVGNSGANQLSGLAGNDVLEGGGGADTLDGGDGFDFANYANASAAVTANLATGVVTGPEGGDTLIAMESLIGSAFADTLTGDAGTNFLRGGAGNDTLDGGDGSDFADYASAAGAVQVNLATGVVSGADGVDTLISIERLRGTTFDDTFVGNAGANWFRGGAGNDTIDGGAGEDWLDFINVNNGVFVDFVAGFAYGESTDRDVFSNVEHVRGSNLDDWLVGNAATNVLRGGAGDDILDGGDGIDIADYSEATGGVTVDLVRGTGFDPDGYDTLRRIEGAYGSAFADMLIGNAGDNVFQGGDGVDTIVGGGGLDIARYTDASAAITANLAAHLFTGAAADDVLQGIEGIQATNFADSLIGDDADNIFRGNLGDDTIDGAGGRDVADYRNAESAVVVNLAAGTATGGDGNDTLSHIESAWGSFFDDRLTGDAGDNVLRGREGNDTLDGGGGVDTADFGSAVSGVTASLALGTASGPDGNDVLISIENLNGSEHDDALTGSDGDNVLYGDHGNDTLTGLGGTDTALYDGARSAYTVSKVRQNFVVDYKSGVDGHDTLSSMDRLQFSDKTFELVNLPRTAAPDYGKDPGFLFDGVYYLLSNPDKVPTVTLQTALADYFASGAAQHLDPNSWFDASYYSSKWADLAPLHLDDATLFMHYNLYGVWEGRSAGPKFDHFDGNRYLTDWPDVAAYVDANLPAFLGSRTNGAIAHFIIYGANEQRTAYDTEGALIDMGYVV